MIKKLYDELFYDMTDTRITIYKLDAGINHKPYTTSKLTSEIKRLLHKYHAAMEKDDLTEAGNIADDLLTQTRISGKSFE